MGNVSLNDSTSLLSIFNNGQLYYFGATEIFPKDSKGKVKTNIVSKPENAKSSDVEVSEGETKAQAFTNSVLAKHIAGTVYVALNPLGERDTCTWACIDIDHTRYNMDTLPITLYEQGFPFAPCYSKSGNLHLFIFFKEPISGDKAQNICKEYVQTLSLEKKTEIFPKQRSIAKAEKGNGIFLPYYDVKNIKGKEHRCISPDGELLNIRQFVELVEHNLTLPLSTHYERIRNWRYYNAPPCIRSGVLSKGDLVNGRNIWLYNVCVWARIIEAPNIEKYVFEANKTLAEPLDEKEIRSTILKGAEKETYFYNCTLADCNKELCRRTGNGIGTTKTSDISYGQLTQVMTDPPTYTWVINGQPFRFYSEEELINQAKFRKLATRYLHHVPSKVSDAQWSDIVNKALDNVVVENPDTFGNDFATGATLEYAICEFFTSRTLASSIDKVVMGQVYKDETKNEYVFTANSLYLYVRNKMGLRQTQPPELRDKIQSMGAHLENGNWYIPTDSIVGANVQKEIVFIEEQGQGF